MVEDTVSKPAMKNSTAWAVRSSSDHTVKERRDIYLGSNGRPATYLRGLVNAELGTLLWHTQRNTFIIVILLCVIFGF